MIAALIFVISFAALLQFFVLHCRSILAYSRRVELSDRVREVDWHRGPRRCGGRFRALAPARAALPRTG